MPLDWQGQWDDIRLNQQFKNDLQSILGPDEENWRVEKPAYRSPEEQDALYAQGRTTAGEIVTQAKGGQSPHNAGLAADVCRLVGVGIGAKERWDYDSDSWTRLRALVDEHPRLHGGWHFPHPDPDHIESTHWADVRAAKIAAGDW